MHIATLITLILVSLLVLSISLLFSFSYNTFIPRNINFGIIVYFVSISILILGRQTYFYKVKKTSYKKFTYVIFPSLVSIIIAILILFYFPIQSKYNGIGEGGLGNMARGFIIYLYLFAGLWTIALLLFFTAKKQYEVTHKSNKSIYFAFFDKIIARIAFLTIPALIGSIGYILFLAYSDYIAAGMTYSHTSKSNINIMYKKAKEEKDITYCDHIINVRDKKYSQERCYENFLEGPTEIQQPNNREKTTDINFFSLYKKLRTQQCEKSEKPVLCENILLELTLPILELTSKRKVDFDTKKITIVIYDESNYEGIYDFLIRDLNEFMSVSLVSIEKTTASTVIYIYIKNLIENEDSLLKIETIIKERQSYIEKLNYQKRTIKMKEENKKYILKIKKRKKEFQIAKLKYETDMRKKYRIKPNDLVQRCPDEKHDKCWCVISMCVNGEFVYDAPRTFIIPHGGFNEPYCAYDTRTSKEPICENSQPIKVQRRKRW